MSAFERGFVNTLMLRERFNKNNSASISRICVLRRDRWLGTGHLSL